MGIRGILIICIIVCVLLSPAVVIADDKPGDGDIVTTTKPTPTPEPTLKPTPEPTKQPVNISDSTTVVDKAAVDVTSPETTTFKITTPDQKITWDTLVFVYPDTKYLISPDKLYKTVDYVSVADTRFGHEYPLYETYYGYGESRTKPWSSYWRVVNPSISQGKYVEMIYAEFDTKSVKRVLLTPIEWDYVKKDIDAGVIPDIYVLKEYWGVK